jgi:hypothetical protein
VVIQGETDEIAVGALTLELVSNQPKNFDRYFNALKPDRLVEADTTTVEIQTSPSTSARNPWFNQFWEQRFACSLSASPACHEHQLNETNWDSKLQFIVDATYVFAQALHAYLNCSVDACPNTSRADINGKKLFRIILQKAFLSELFHRGLVSTRSLPRGEAISRRDLFMYDRKGGKHSSSDAKQQNRPTTLHS